MLKAPLSANKSIHIFLYFVLKHLDLFETYKFTPVHKNMYVQLPYHSVFYRQTRAHALQCKVFVYYLVTPTERASQFWLMRHLYYYTALLLLPDSYP